MLAALGTLSLGACTHAPWHGMGHHAPLGYASAADEPARSARIDAHRQAMRSLHEAIVAARSPEERLAVLERHRALMRDGFAHSHGGRDGGCPHHAEATPSSSLR
jgi:hypothetical protein